MRHLIVGNGPAGVKAAETLRRIAPGDDVVLVAEEAQPFYSKVLTSYFVAGKKPYENMLLADSEHFRQLEIRLLAGKRAVGVDAAAREVTLAAGEKVAYDRLLLATGAAPYLPPIQGVETPGVFTLWTHDDAVRLNEWIREGQRALVIGAGLVGLKAAEAFLARGLSVTVVELLDRVLPQVLDKEDADRVQRELAKRGVAVRTSAAVGEIAGDGQVRKAILADGSEIDCDVVVIATGVRPNLALAKSAGVAIGRGILVNQFLQTSAPDIYAAGDVAEAWDAARGRRLPNPTWGNAAEQGRVAAHNMAGRTKPYLGAVSMNTFTFLGFNLVAVGITQPEDDHVRVERHLNPRTGDYRKLIMLGDRLVGAVAMGDLRMAGIWRWLIARRGPDAPIAEALLASKTGFAWTYDMASLR